MEDLTARLLDGTAQIWSSPLACVVTEVTPPDVHIWLAGGDLRSVLAFQTPLEYWARSLGCTSLTLSGRLGWDRVLKPLGYERDGDALRKML